jgi:hypothetical protein
VPHRSRARRFALVAPAVAALAAAVSLGTAPAGRAAGAVGFTQPVYVDQTRAGGEPGVIHSTKFGTLIYSSHEGTTHIDRVGLGSKSTVDFLCPDPSGPNCYENHVWVWTSNDNGATWTWRDEGLSYTGFSDPDLTEDAGGNIYDTGIDLANDALFSSSDGGVTWPNGTAQCHDGDRPWLAGGVAGEVFLTTDTNETGHTLFHSSNLGASCDSTGIADSGTMPDGLVWSGFGKGVYDPVDHSFIEPAQFAQVTQEVAGQVISSQVVKVGISRLPNAADAFKGGGETFQAVEVADTPGVYSPFGAPEVISMDSAQNLYFAWDTDDRDANGSGGCGQVPSTSQPNGGPTPLPNRIMLEIGKYVSPGVWQWQKPISLAHQGNARVLWPWSVAGSPGNLSVAWYQMDKMVDPDCDMYNNTTVPDVRTYIYEAHITGALDPSTRQITVTNASGREIHQGGICDSGTTCVATGQDRRLGDYFEINTDANGCVIIASGDTTVPDTVSAGPRAISLPIFLRQNSGPSLTGKDCANPTAAAVQGVTATPSSSPTPSHTAGGVAGASTLPNTAATGVGLGAPVAAGALAAMSLGAVAARRRRKRL